MPFIGKQSSGHSKIKKSRFTATASQTDFSVVSAAGDELQVFLNGVLLKETDDYTYTTSTVTLGTGASVNDIVEVHVYQSFTIADTVDIAGDTMTGELEVPTVKLSSNVIKASDGGSTITLDTSDNVTIGGDLKVTNVKHASSSSNNLVLGSDGSASFPNTTIGGLQSIQVFDDPSANGTATNTWTKPSGIRRIKVYVTGGGGGGGGGQATNDFSGAGGAGGTAIKVIDVSSVSSVSVIIGNGGTGRSRTDSSNGGDGSASSFGSYCTGNGGYGGESGNAGAPAASGNGSGRGGTATGGDINLYGGGGGHRYDNSGISTTYGWSVNVGGGSFWGGGECGPVSAANTERNALVYGTGGGGTVYAGSMPKAGDGADGIVVVEEYI